MRVSAHAAPLPTAKALALRDELLHGDMHADPMEEVARFKAGWVRFGPFSLTGLFTAGVFVAMISEVQRRVDPLHWAPLRGIIHWFGTQPIVLVVAEGVLMAVALVAVPSTLGYVSAYWGYHLSSHPAGTLHVARGLISTRGTTIEKRRLRGVVIIGPLLLRLVSGARLNAITTGLRENGPIERSGAVLVPPAPVGLVREVAATVIGTAEPFAGRLPRHGPRARQRRYVRAITAWVAVVAALIAISTHVLPAPRRPGDVDGDDCGR
jgi:putative membrane protein